MNNELLPCPFCGGEVCFRYQEKSGVFSSGMEEPNIGIECCHYYHYLPTERWDKKKGYYGITKESKEILTKAWNTRADKAAPVERIEGALEKLLRQFSIQNLSSEMDDEALERADFQSAYDMFINKTRAYLKHMED